MNGREMRARDLELLEAQNKLRFIYKSIHLDLVKDMNIVCKIYVLQMYETEYDSDFNCSLIPDLRILMTSELYLKSIISL